MTVRTVRYRVLWYLLALCLAGGLALAGASPALAQGTDPAAAPGSPSTSAAIQEQMDKANRFVEEVFRGQSLTIGLGFAISRFSHLRDDQFPDASNEFIALSDSGTWTPFVAYNSPEKLFAHETFANGGFLHTGGIAFGLNLIANLATFQATRELKNGQLIGSASNNRVTGEYLLGAPLLFLRLGPLLSPESEIYLRAGVGYGVALSQFNAKLRYTHTGFADVHERLDHPPNALDAAVVNLLELRIGRWLVQGTSLTFGGRTRSGSYAVGNLAVNGGYTFSF